ncbi:MAG TPA: insulinase family protein, partial [Archangium sp.]
MRPLLSRCLVLSVALCLGGCATTSRTPPPPEPQPPAQPQAQAPAEPQAPATVPAVPLQKPEPMRVVVQANPASPIVSFRLVFHTGSVDDPQGKEGLTSLTADLLSEGGTQSLTSAQLLEVLF